MLRVVYHMHVYDDEGQLVGEIMATMGKIITLELE
jgi:hypothetical protein